MNYSSKVGSSSMTSTSNSIKDVYVDAMVYRLILFRYITKYFILYIQ
jgi:hypothetical protein